MKNGDIVTLPSEHEDEQFKIVDYNNGNMRLESLTTETEIFGATEEECELCEPDHEYREEITCPYCGDIVRDSWKEADYGENECDGCGGKYSFERTIEEAVYGENERDSFGGKYSFERELEELYSTEKIDG